MKTFFRIFAMFMALLLLSSCGNKNKGTVEQSAQEPSLVAYQYKVADAGDGWSLGKLSLAFENTKTDLVPPRGSNWGYSVNDAFVETQEGKTYPIRVYADYGSFAKAEGNAQSSENYISFDMPSIPPSFRVYKWMSSSNGKAGGNYVLEFKFANAAHPTKIIFPSKPEWNIILNEVPNNLQMPLISSNGSIASFTSLEGKVLVDESGKLLITLGKCKIKSGAGYIDVISQNRDNLDSASTIFEFPELVYIGNGEMTHKGSERINPLVGPGQTVTQEVWAFNDDSSYVIFYWNDGTHDIAKVDGCNRE